MRVLNWMAIVESVLNLVFVGVFIWFLVQIVKNQKAAIRAEATDHKLHAA